MRNSKIQHIVDTAERHFALHGYNKVTMEDIAAELGVSKASLYYYFKDKGEVFKAVFEKIEGAFWDDLSALFEKDMPGRKRLKTYLELRFRLFHKYLTIAGIGSGPIVELNSMLPRLAADFRTKECGIVKRILESSDEFRRNDLDRTSELVVNLMFGMRLRHRHAGVPLDDLSREIEPFLEILFHGLAKR